MIYKFIIIYGVETHVEIRARCQSPGVESPCTGKSLGQVLIILMRGIPLQIDVDIGGCRVSLSTRRSTHCTRKSPAPPLFTPYTLN